MKNIYIADKTKHRGFTLVEMIVVVAIISIIATVVGFSFTDLRGGSTLREATNTLINSVKDIRQRSVSVRRFGYNEYPNYGVVFEKDVNTVTLYADCKSDDNNDGNLDYKDDFTYDDSSTDCDTSGTDYQENGFLSEVTLASDVIIADLQLSGDLVGGDVDGDGNRAGDGDDVQANPPIVYLEFVRPEPTVWISDSSGNILPTGQITVVLENTQTGSTKELVFNATGAVYDQ